MTALVTLAASTATATGFVPIAWCGYLVARKRTIDRAGVLIALGLSISGLADLAALAVDPWLISTVYVVAQAGIIGAVFMRRPMDLIFLGLLSAVALVDVVVFSTQNARIGTIPLQVVASLGILMATVNLWERDRMRFALFVLFGIGLVAWIVCALAPSWGTWIPYQVIRLWGAVLVCRAIDHKRRLRAVENLREA